MEFRILQFRGILAGISFGDHTWVFSDIFLGGLEPSNPPNRLRFEVLLSTLSS